MTMITQTHSQEIRHYTNLKREIKRNEKEYDDLNVQLQLSKERIFLMLDKVDSSDDDEPASKKPKLHE